MKHLLLIAVIICAAFLFYLSLQEPEDTPSQAAQWQAYVRDQEAAGMTVLSVVETQQWLKKHSPKHVKPDGLAFLDEHPVHFVEAPYFLVRIVIDHNGEYRGVRGKITPVVLPTPPTPQGYLSEQASLQWLRNQGYSVQKSGNTYTLKKAGFTYVYNNSGLVLGPSIEGVELSIQNDRLYIKPKK